MILGYYLLPWDFKNRKKSPLHPKRDEVDPTPFLLPASETIINKDFKP